MWIRCNLSGSDFQCHSSWKVPRQNWSNIEKNCRLCCLSLSFLFSAISADSYQKKFCYGTSLEEYAFGGARVIPSLSIIKQKMTPGANLQPIQYCLPVPYQIEGVVTSKVGGSGWDRPPLFLDKAALPLRVLLLKTGTFLQPGENWGKYVILRDTGMKYPFWALSNIGHAEDQRRRGILRKRSRFYCCRLIPLHPSYHLILHRQVTQKEGRLREISSVVNPYAVGSE